MHRRTPGFTTIELAFSVLIVLILAAVLLAASESSRRSAGIQGSIDRLRRITGAAQVYHLDHAGQVPLRGCRYTNGNISGWDSWECGGKDCNAYWQTGQFGLYDESAYSRPLNAYLYAGQIPIPAGYVNTGSGSTWTLSPGTPSAEERATLQIPVFQSPGDRVSYQGSDGWPYGVPNPNRSCYNDVGTSYIPNMAWWNDPTIPSGPAVQRFNEGTRRMSLDFSGANPNFVWAGDQAMDLAGFRTANAPGEWGKPNASVVAFADGRVLYIRVVPGAHSGPGYTFWP